MSAHRDDIDGLRAIAVLSVMVFHARAAWLPGGFVGVDIFFAISGYLITRNIVTDLQAGRFSFAEFYRRRIRRIAPMMLLVVAVTTLLSQLLMTPDDGRAVAKSAVWSLLSMANVHFWRDLDTGYFAQSSAEIPLLHLWSLGVEEQFYFAWPVMVVLLWRRLPPVWVLGLTGLVCLVSFEWGQQVYGNDPSFAYYMLPTRAGELLVGALLGIAAALNWDRRLSARFAGVAGWLGAGLIAGSCVVLNEHDLFPGWRALLPTAGAVLVILAGSQGHAGAVTRLLRLRPLVGVGKVSYSAYLWHWPVFAWFRYGYGSPSTAVAIGLLVLTLVLAAASYRLVEQPTHRSAADFKATFARMFGVPGLLLLALSLVVVYADRLRIPVGSSGYLSRLDALREQTRPAYLYDWICQRQRLQAKDLTDTRCVSGSPGSDEPDALMWGDSNAAHYVPMVKTLAEHAGARFRNVAVGACPPLLTDPAAYVDSRRLDDCRASNDLVSRQLVRYRMVIIAASWASYRDRSDQYMDDVAKLVQSLSAQGKQVVLIGRAPILAGYDRRCAEKALRTPFRACPDLSQPLPRQVVDVNRALEGLARRYPNVRYFDANAVLCPNGTCLQADSDGRPRFFDEGHLTVSASTQVGHDTLAAGGLPAAFAGFRSAP